MPRERMALLSGFLRAGLGREVELAFAESYDQLTRSLLAGEVHLAWSPPFASARLESAGASVLVRALRGGQATYRAALVTRSEGGVTLETLKGARAAWVDKESVGGYLLTASWLKKRGPAPERLFASQRFVGSYQRALEAVLSGEADVCSCLAAPSAVGDALNIAEFTAAQTSRLLALGFSEESPNDGVVAAPLSRSELRERLTRTFLDAHVSEAGRQVLSQVFRAERFERAPAKSYRPLYLALRVLQ